MYNLLKLQDVCMNLNHKSIKTRKKQPTNKAYDKKKKATEKKQIYPDSFKPQNCMP